MRRILNLLINIVTKNWLLIAIVILGIFLRFYRFPDFITFLGDQGRDAIILKRIIALEHFPAVGPPTSVGQVYLGPFYYYFIAPWLWFFKFDPIGPAVGVALLSSLYLLVNYLVVKELVDKKTALISTVFLTFSSALIELSRFSWNPNLLPLFILLTIYFVVKSIKTHRRIFFALAGAFLSFSIQLHYLALFMLPAAVLLYGNYFIKKARQIKKSALNFVFLAVNFLIFSSPLIVFDLRHQFLNSKNFLKLFQESGTTFITKVNSLFDSFYYLNFFSFHIELNRFFLYIILFLLVVCFITLYRQKSPIKPFLLFFLMTLLLMSFYSGPKHPHYFGILYGLYYIVVAYSLTFFKDSLWGKAVVSLFVAGFIFLNFQKYPYFRAASNNQIGLAKAVTQKIYDNIAVDKFTVTALPEKYSDSTYRYFLELWGKRAIEKDSLDRARELFVVCETDCPLIIGNPQWDIAYFAPNKIVNEWTVNGVKIYKLIR